MAFLNCVVVVAPVMVRQSVPFCKTRPVPERPATVTPMATVPVLQVIWTLVTLADAVPLPPETVQVCVGGEGGVETDAKSSAFSDGGLESESAVAIDGEAVAAIILQHHPCAGHAGHRTADCEGTGTASSAPAAGVAAAR